MANRVHIDLYNIVQILPQLPDHQLTGIFLKLFEMHHQTGRHFGFVFLGNIILLFPEIIDKYIYRRRIFTYILQRIQHLARIAQRLIIIRQNIPGIRRHIGNVLSGHYSQYQNQNKQDANPIGKLSFNFHIFYFELK